jgi:hypothetical protein
MGLGSSPAGYEIYGFPELGNALSELIKKFQDPAAHIDQLGQKDYEACRKLVIGPDGIFL